MSAEPRDDGPAATLGQAPAPLAADVGVVAAMSIEVGHLLDQLERVRKYRGGGHVVIEGEHAGLIVALIVGGVGRSAARRASLHLLEGHRPRLVVSAGFAGALDPALRRNEVVVPREIVDPEGRVHPVDQSGPATGHGSRVLSGRLATVDAVVLTAAAKAELRASTGADLVDMETSAVAETCGARGVRFRSVRVVSDVASEDLPREVLRLNHPSRSYVAGAALRAIWDRPSSLKDMLVLYQRANEAADRLAEVVLAGLSRPE